jgi:hypothetical protein
VEWLQLGDHVDPVDPGHLLESRALGEIVTKWITLVREGGWERVDGQLDWILSELGTMPPENRCNARALCTMPVARCRPLSRMKVHLLQMVFARYARVMHLEWSS